MTEREVTREEMRDWMEDMKEYISNTTEMGWDLPAERKHRAILALIDSAPDATIGHNRLVTEEDRQRQE